MTKPLTKAAQKETSETAITTSRSGVNGSTSSGSPTLGDAVARWYTSLATRDMSPRTIDAYRHSVDRLVQHLSAGTLLADITPEDVEAFMSDLKAKGLNSGGRHHVYRPVRTFFKWAVSRDLLVKSPVDKVAAPKVQPVPMEFVTDDQFAAILKTTEHRTRWAFRARRDRAILLMLATTGARLSEVADLTLDQLDMAAGQFTVHGKTGTRDLPLLPDALAALSDYLRLERPRSPFSAGPAVWLAPRGALTSNGLAQMVADRGKAAGLQRRVHPHELRHRFAAKALAGGMPGPLVQELAGWSSPAMLSRYGKATRAEDAMAYLRKMAG